MTDKINLDSLIPREDLALVGEQSRGWKKKESITATDLCADEFFLLNLFKPDFQRETTDWDYTKICDFVSSFLQGELIPAVILWQSADGKIFVIDGAHRLSSLIAWINDDYGDGPISRRSYYGSIPDGQVDLAQKARLYIEKNVGKYSEVKRALTDPDLYEKQTVDKARLLSSAGIQLQWVPGSDVHSAEKSFLNINQKASPINKTEMQLIKYRKKPIGIASRAIMHGGKGHKYWASFDSERRSQVEEIAAEISKIFFFPPLNNPIKTVDVPLLGKQSSSSLPMIVTFVQICNSIGDDGGEDDKDGETTLACLKQTRKIARLLNDIHCSSLGLHPLVYFYSKNGAYRVANLYAFTSFVMELDKRNMKDRFIKQRALFEKVLYENDPAIDVIVRKARSAKSSVQPLQALFFRILETLESGIAAENVISELRKTKEYEFLPENELTSDIQRADFSSSKKSEVFIREAVSNISRCSICGGAIHQNSITIDHIIRKEDGGKGSTDNGQIAHPYCNSGFKN